MSMQGCLHCQKPRSEEKYVFTADDTSARVEGIRTLTLLLNTHHFVDVVDTFGVPNFRRNLVFVSTLDRFGYTCTFGNRKVNIRDIKKCVNFIKVKNTHTIGKESSRAKELLQLLHMNTCGLFPTAMRNGHRYFITFTYDYS